MGKFKMSTELLSSHNCFNQVVYGFVSNTHMHVHIQKIQNTHIDPI